MEKKYILISPGSQTSRQMLADLKDYKCDNFQFVEQPVKLKNNFTKKIFELYFKINARINLPYKRIWHKLYPFSKVNLKEGVQYYFILGNGNFNYYSSKYLNKLKEKYDFHYVIYFIDPLSGLSSEYMRKNIFSLNSDLIFTFDYYDAKKINAIHTMNLYSKKEISLCGEVKKNSIYFVGTNKSNRLEKVHKIWDELSSKDIECNFKIVNVPEVMQSRKGIIYNQMRTYDQVLEELQDYECILEVLQEGQVGVTLRYYEAVVYNKRLITNNVLVKQLPFYNSEYMFVFETIEDINVDWIKKDVVVDYGYNNEFSPINFVKDVIRNT